MKIFVDVGAHHGQSAITALAPQYGFDKIVCFEPAPSCWPQLESIKDSRIELWKVGLWKQSCRRLLYRDGFLGASIFADMENLRQSDSRDTSIELIRASDWFADHVPSEALVFLKLNCEGSECDILDDLMDSGELNKVYNVMIDFDVRFIPSMRSRELDIRRRLNKLGVKNVAFADEVMRGETHEKRIQNWLTTVGAHENLSRAGLEQKYSDVLAKLASGTGAKARLRLAARRFVYARLPRPVQNLIASAWHLVRGRA